MLFFPLENAILSNQNCSLRHVDFHNLLFWGKKNGKKYYEKVKVFHFNIFGREAKGEEVFFSKLLLFSNSNLLSITRIEVS